MWGNPYGDQANYKSVAAAENRKRVQRQKEERAFMQGMRTRFQLSHMDEVRRALQDEREQKLAASRIASSNGGLRGKISEQSEEDDSRSDAVVEPLKCVGEFSTSAVRCLEVTQGGATLWTGEGDGSIGVRNGVTGDLAYVIDRHEDSAGGVDFVDALFCSDTLMWAGMSSGAVRVYDAQVFVLVYEGEVHSKSVTSFAHTFDNKIFSASVDGTIAKWDIDSTSSIDVVAHLTGNTSALRAIATYGYHLFAAADDNMIHCLDTETGATTQLFEGHTAGVTSVLVMRGLLVSGSADGTLGVWNIGTGAREGAAEVGASAKVSALMADAVGGNVWSADATGTIRLWALREDASLVPLRTITLPSSLNGSAPAAVLSLKGFVAIDAAKIWTMGSNGECHVWHAANNRIESETLAALRSMQAIIAEDEVELAKWAELIKTMEEVHLRLKDSIAANLEIATERGNQRMAFLVWQRFVLFSHIRKTKRFLADRLAAAEVERTQRIAFRKLQCFLHGRKQQRAKDAAVAALSLQGQRELVTVFYAKLRAHYRAVRAREWKLAASAAQERHSNEIIASRYLALLRAFLDRQRRRRKQAEMALELMVGCDHTLREQFFVRWMKIRVHSHLRRDQARAAIVMMSKSDDALRHRYFARWMMNASECARKRFASKAASIVLVRHTDRWLRQACYHKWQRFTADRRDSRLEEEFANGQQRAAELRVQLDAIEHLVRRRRLLDDAQSAINAALHDRLRKQERIRELEDEALALQQSIQVKRDGAKAKREQSVAEQIADLLAELKCKLLNLHSDFVLINKIVEKSRHVAAPKIFLESHQAVKRVVVELTSNPYLPSDERWPLTAERLKMFRPHQVEPVLTAIKTMVITFDIMSPQERATLNSASEIVLNAENITTLADLCIKAKLKKFGKSAFRAK